MVHDCEVFAETGACPHAMGRASVRVGPGLTGFVAALAEVLEGVRSRLPRPP